MQLHPSVRRVLFNNELQLGKAEGLGRIAGVRSFCRDYLHCNVNDEEPVEVPLTSLDLGL